MEDLQSIKTGGSNKMQRSGHLTAFTRKPSSFFSVLIAPSRMTEVA